MQHAQGASAPCQAGLRPAPCAVTRCWHDADIRRVLLQAMALSKEATLGWEAGSMQGRQTALASCKEAVESAETCHRELVNVFKMNT